MQKAGQGRNKDTFPVAVTAKMRMLPSLTPVPDPPNPPMAHPAPGNSNPAVFPEAPTCSQRHLSASCLGTAEPSTTLI